MTTSAIAPVLPQAPSAPGMQIPGINKEDLFLAVPIAAVAAVGVVGGILDHRLAGAGIALLGVAAIAAFDFAYLSYESKMEMQAHQDFIKTHPAALQNPGDTVPTFPIDPGLTPEARVYKEAGIKAVLGVTPLAVFAVGLAIHHFTESTEAGKLLMIAGGGGAAANLYLLLGGPLPFVGIKK